MRSFQVGVLELSCRAFQITMLRERHAPRVVADRDAGCEPYCLRIPCLCTNPIAAQCQHIPFETHTVNEAVDTYCLHWSIERRIRFGCLAGLLIGRRRKADVDRIGG